MSTLKHYVTNVAAQGSARALSLAANLVTFVIIARALGADVLGQFAFLMAFVGIASSAADLGTTSILARGLAHPQEDGGNAYFGNFLLLRAGLAAAVTLLAIIFAFLADGELLPELLLCAIAVPFVASRFFEPVYQVFERPWYSVYASFLYSLSQLIMVVVILLWLEKPLMIYLYGFLVSNMIYAVVAMFLALRIIRPAFAPDLRQLRIILTLAAPVGVASFFTIINRRADVLMLNELRTSYEVGIYSAAYKLLDFGALLAVTITTPLIPVLSRKIAESKTAAKPHCMRIMELVAVATFPLAIAAPYVADPVILLLFGNEYIESASILPVFAWIFVLIIYSLIGSAINLALGEVAHGYWNAALAASINIALNMLWIPQYGIMGAVGATLISHFALLAVSQYYVARHMGILFFSRRWMKILFVNLILFAGLKLYGEPNGLWAVSVAAVIYLAVLSLMGVISLVPGSRKEQ
jgi:O-antigen/teichoic acid export membrane protein